MEKEKKSEQDALRRRKEMIEVVANQQQYKEILKHKEKMDDLSLATSIFESSRKEDEED